MLAALALAYVIVGPSGAIEARGTTAATASRPAPPTAACSAPATLAHDPGVAYQPMKGPLPADLPGPRFKLPSKIAVPLEVYLPPPAPFGTKINVGKAEIDLKTGGVSINGQDFTSGAAACP